MWSSESHLMVTAPSVVSEQQEMHVLIFNALSGSSGRLLVCFFFPSVAPDVESE